jgi:hypothetical protein
LKRQFSAWLVPRACEQEVALSPTFRTMMSD